jgi:hypothetical protein
MTSMQRPVEALLRGLTTPGAIAKAIKVVADHQHKLFSEKGPPRLLWDLRPPAFLSLAHPEAAGLGLVQIAAMDPPVWTCV